MRPPSHIEADVGDGSSSSSASSSSSSSPSSYLIDHLRFMREQETHYRINPDCLSAPGAIITPDDRRAMCSWSYQIVDSCSVDRSVAVIGMSYLDRFMSTSSPGAAAALASRREYQLAVVSCLVIALKCRGGIKVGTGFVADDVCQSLYGADELEAMEMEVLRALTWRLSGPSPHDFVDAIVGLLPPSSSTSSSSYSGASSLVLSATAHVEAAVLDRTMAAQPSSSLAYAALLTSLRKTEFLDGIRPAELFAWTQKLASIACGKMGRVFVRELSDVARRRWFASMTPSPPPSPVLVDGVDDVRGRGGTSKSAIGAHRESKIEGAIYCCIETSSTTSSTRSHGSGEDDFSISGPCSLDALALGY